MWPMRSAVKSLRREKRKLREQRTKGKIMRQAGRSKEAAAPKKKNLAFVIRPQNSRNSSRIQGNRPAQRQARPGQQGGRPDRGAARPAHGAVRRERDRYALNARPWRTSCS